MTSNDEVDKTIKKISLCDNKLYRHKLEYVKNNCDKYRWRRPTFIRYDYQDWIPYEIFDELMGVWYNNWQFYNSELTWKFINNK